ncbi:Uncharacterised protein [Legionella birminghamensis]|uniref:Uncharacterized protein n=1 Tax=Legionella birminghamensis TaxID=28083 RepID=A0A378IBU2_9GAMM|nr:Uncharacterised protein [Legionella birminghamensis]
MNCFVTGALNKIRVGPAVAAAGIRMAFSAGIRMGLAAGIPMVLVPWVRI